MVHRRGGLTRRAVDDVADGADGTGIRALCGKAVASLTVEAMRAGEIGVAD
jgi:hypothetical protein